MSSFRPVIRMFCECICAPLSLKRKMCTTAMYAKHSPASHVHLHYNLGYLYTTMLHILAQSCPSEVFSAEFLCDVLSILNAHVQRCATIRIQLYIDKHKESLVHISQGHFPVRDPNKNSQVCNIQEKGSKNFD